MQNCEGIEPYKESALVEGVAFDKDDILIANIRPYLKKAWIATFSGVCSTDVLAFRIDKALSKYVYHLIENDAFFTYVMSGAKGSKMPRGDKQHILDYHFALPSIREQEKISKFISLINLRIGKQRQLIEILKSYKRGLLHTLLDDIPERVSLADISEYYSSNNTMSAVEKHNIGAFSVYDASGKVEHIDSYDFDFEYVAIIKDGSGVGRLQLCEAQSSIIGTLGAIKPKGCSVNYLYAVLQNIDFRQFTTGMAIPHIYYKDYRSVLVPFPDKAMQNKIEMILSKIDTVITHESALLDLLQLAKSSLLQQLFI